LEMGLVGLAVPVCRGTEGCAALGVSVHAGRVSGKEMISRLLPILQETAGRIALGMTSFSAP
jgi:DNA-binding IclR family transcriptional regulator